MLNNLINEILLNRQYSYLVVVENGKVAQKIFNQLNFICNFLSYPVNIYLFPDYETLPYEKLPIAHDILYNRLFILNKIKQQNSQVIVTEIGTLMRKLPLPNNLPKGLSLSNNVTFSALKQELIKNDFLKVNQVTSPKEYAVRGGIIDFYLGKHPYRLDFEDEQLKNSWILDPESQRSIKKVNNITFFPAHEVILNDETIEIFKKNWQTHFKGKSNSFFKKIINYRYHQDLENYLPLFYSNTTSLLDYFYYPCKIIKIGNLEIAANNYLELVKQQYQNRVIIDALILKPEQLFFTLKELTVLLNKREIINLINNNQNTNKTDYEIFISNSRYYLDTLKIPIIKHYNEIEHNNSKYAVFDEQINEDFTISYQNNNLFFKTKFNLNSTKKITPKELVNKINIDLNQLKTGDLVVHRNYGIGRFISLVKEDLGDFILIEYANCEKLYIASDQLHLISRYLGTEEVALNSLHNKNWEKTTQKAKEQIKDLAIELLTLQAKRQTIKKNKFIIPNEYQKFQDDCPFILTQDQEIILSEIQQDFKSEYLMDRLICGDVGFGKTEIAMHAAFLSVYNNQQVILIAPTTVLVNQHLETFKRRFFNFPINIKSLTRNNNAKIRQQLLMNFNEGKIDILITTLTFFPGELKRLGLLIIDEEHRFGVEQKEHFKQWVTKLGVLSLTATPIPRSLNLAMLGIRNFSLLQTPPAKKLPVKTIVSQYQENIIKEAIQRELLRGGQVYFVHNRIAQLPHFCNLLSKMFPNNKIVSLHGKNKDNLKTMQLFLRQEIDILVCTNLIESGLDFKNANTIIINDADLFGIADLHQLRGRVGRFSRQAYAYLLLSKEPTLKAKKRLLALSQYDTLGSGINLALEDLNLRGAGEFLGKKQSGAMNNLGFNLYMELLQEAIRQNEVVDHNNIILNTNLETRFPEEYINETSTRLQFYKRFSNCTQLDEIEILTQELQDRFGNLPAASYNLVMLTKYKIRLKLVGVQKGYLKKEWLIVFNNASIYFQNEGFKLFQTLGTKVKYTANSVNFIVDSDLPFWNNLECLTTGLEKIFIQKK